MFYSHTHYYHYYFNHLIAINKSSQNESGIATIRHTNSLSPQTMKFKNNFIGKTKITWWPPRLSLLRERPRAE